jgi:uncharacterized protein YecE (DUF72 family)
MNHRIGTVDLPPRLGMQRYFSELPALELSATFSSIPKPSLVARWKAEAPERSLALAAPWVISHRKAPASAKSYAADAGSGEFRDSPAVRSALAEFSKVCGELSPWAVVFTSPSLFSPSTTNRDRLRHFFAEVAPAELFGEAKRVWVPDGLWEPLTAVRFATELGITCAIDPLVQIPGMPPDLHFHYETSDLYFRIHAIGRTRGLREDDLMSVEELSAFYEEAAFILATQERWKDAKNVLKRLSEEKEEEDPIERMNRRAGGAAQAFQRPAGSAAAAAATAAALGTAFSGDDEEGDDEDFDDDDFEDEDGEDEEEDGAEGEGESAGVEGAEGAVEAGEGEGDEEDDEDEDDEDDEDDEEDE